MLASDDKPLLSCDAVSVHFGALAAVNELSFDVLSGEILGVGGPNGAGKTTLFDVISGFTPASSGRITLDGHVITGRPPHRVCHLGLSRTFQLNAAYDSLTVRENILCASYYGFKNVIFPNFRFNRTTRARADDAIAFVGLENFSDTIVGILPILQRKLLMLAAAVVRQPKILLLDEPVGGLNRQEIDEIMNLIQRYRDEHKLTIVFIEHVMRFLVALSDRALIMHHGQKIFEGPASDLARDKTVTEVYLGERMAERLRHDGVANTTSG